jgi:hypothetical protein
MVVGHTTHAVRVSPTNVFPIWSKPPAEARGEARSVQDYLRERLCAAAPDVIPVGSCTARSASAVYACGETRLKLFVRGLRPGAPPEPVVRFETEPGQQMPSDWATIRCGYDSGRHRFQPAFLDYAESGLSGTGMIPAVAPQTVWS